MDSNGNEPSWLSHENDHLHQKQFGEASASESEPLFGSGKIPLEGEVVETTTTMDDYDDEEVAKKNYGAVKEEASTASKKSKKSKKKSKSPPRTPVKSIFDDDSDNNNGMDIDDETSSGLFGDGETTLTMTLDSKPHMPHRNWCLETFRIIAAITVISSLGLLTTQIIPLVLAPELRSDELFALALKIYISLFCILFVLVEVDAPIPFLQKSMLLQTYLSRGFIYSFLGLICLEEAYSERVKEIVSTHDDEFHVAWASLFMQISSGCFCACGILYMLMGTCCLKKVRDRMRKKDKDVWKRYRREMKEWKRLNAA